MRYIHPHISLIVALAAVVIPGCSQKSPQIHVLGASQTRAVGPEARNLLVFVEVVNPSSRDLEFSRLDYQVEADSWFSDTGTVMLRRTVGAGSSAVVEIPVPVTADRAAPTGTTVELRGKLFAERRSWSVRVKGRLGDPFASGRARIRVADAH